MTRKAAEAALAAGDLDGCRKALFNAVRENAADPALRSFLFQFCALTGDWVRAGKQLDVLGELKPDAMDLVTDYKAAIRAERVRTAVWAGEMAPPIFGEPRDWIAGLVQAQAHEARGETDAAHALRAEALEAAPADAGMLNDEPFTWCADADTRLGPVMEMIINGEYHWIAMSDIARLEINPPKDLRDLVWAACLLTLSNGGMFPVFLPVRYPGAVESGDPQKMLARLTDFRALAGEHVAGEGQRMLATDRTDVPILELRTLQCNAALASAMDAAEDVADDAADG